MDKPTPIFDPTNDRRVKERIVKLWETSTVRWTEHAKQRMKECDLDVPDVWNTIRRGQIAEHSKPGDLWRFSIDGTSVDGRKTRCVLEINGKVVIITAFTP